MNGVFGTAIIDAAAGYNGYIGAITDVEVVIDDLGEATLTDYYWDMDYFILGIW